MATGSGKSLWYAYSLHLSSDSFFQFLYFIWNIVSFGLPFCLNFVIKLSIASFDRQEDCCSYQPTYILDARSGKDLAHE